MRTALPANCRQKSTRTWRHGLLLVPLCALMLLVPSLAASADLHLTGVTAPDAAPAPDYPVPEDAGMVFYLQRSMNANTVVYAARFDSDGKLKSKKPLAVFWRRYNTDGDKQSLSFIERNMAYGVTTSRQAPGVFRVRFQAIPDIPLVLKQDGAGQAMLTITPKGKTIDLIYGYLQIDESGLLPSVTGIRLFGRLHDGGEPVEVTYSVEGGGISGG